MYVTRITPFAAGPDARRAWLLPAVVAFPLLVMMLATQSGVDAWNLWLGDPDNYMRLAQVRDVLGGQAWSDVTQYRINPPQGLTSHWSRLADLPYIAPIAAMSLVLPASLAERVAVVAIPLILLLLTVAALCRASVSLGGPKAGWAAALLTSTAVMVVGQFTPGRIDHHNLQILLIAVCIAILIGEHSFKRGVLASLSSVLSLSIGLEAAPYVAAMSLWIVGIWVVRGSPARSLAAGFSSGFAIFILVAPAVQSGIGFWLTPVSDSLGRGHVAVACLSCTAFAVLVSRYYEDRTLGRLWRALAASFVGLIGIALFPEIVRAPYAEVVDPILRRLWLENLKETRSFADLWEIDPGFAVASLFFIAAGTIAAAAQALHNAGPRDRFALLALLGTLGFALTCWQIRAASIASVVVLPAAAAALVQVWQRWKEGKSALPLAASILLLGPPFPMAAAATLDFSGLYRSRREVSATSSKPFCEGASNFDVLARMPTGVVLSPIDLSAMILVRTPHSVLTSSNHRGHRENGTAYRIFLASEPEARALLLETQADYVAYCPKAAETDIITHEAPLGFVSRLERGAHPEWVSQVSVPQKGGLRIFSVR